mgnify:CR=1 FL=1
MYEKLMDEGHDARLLRFSPTADFQGGHRDAENKDYWHIGCLGITPSCSTGQEISEDFSLSREFFLKELKTRKKFSEIF